MNVDPSEAARPETLNLSRTPEPPKGPKVLSPDSKIPCSSLAGPRHAANANSQQSRKTHALFRYRVCTSQGPKQRFAPLVYGPPRTEANVLVCADASIAMPITALTTMKQDDLHVHRVFWDWLGVLLAVRAPESIQSHRSRLPCRPPSGV